MITVSDGSLPDLKTGDVFLFEDEPDDKQGHTVVAIDWYTNETIIVYYIPEWTPVANHGMYRYGTKKIKQKYNERLRSI